jgi:ElaB/YqjD/DUF883 family membrane-anchored ribosome-binding protein
MDDFKQGGQASYGDTSGIGSGGAGTAARMKEQISDTAADVKDRVAEFGRKTVDKIDDSRQSAAGALDQTASSLHSGGNKVSSVAHSAADKIQATADYVRRTDLKGMADDVQELVKRYPGQSLAAAAVLGFLVARGMGNRN